ncbi:hypothetical protein LCGC14_2657350, partial [marine sediment metagenome]
MIIRTQPKTILAHIGHFPRNCRRWMRRLWSIKALRIPAMIASITGASIAYIFGETAEDGVNSFLLLCILISQVILIMLMWRYARRRFDSRPWAERHHDLAHRIRSVSRKLATALSIPRDMLGDHASTFCESVKSDVANEIDRVCEEL